MCFSSGKSGGVRSKQPVIRRCIIMRISLSRKIVRNFPLRDIAETMRPSVSRRNFSASGYSIIRGCLITASSIIRPFICGARIFFIVSTSGNSGITSCVLSCRFFNSFAIKIILLTYITEAYFCQDGVMRNLYLYFLWDFGLFMV